MTCFTHSIAQLPQAKKMQYTVNPHGIVYSCTENPCQLKVLFLQHRRLEVESALYKSTFLLTFHHNSIDVLLPL